MLRNIDSKLFILAVFSVFFSQITYESGIRISMPFRYIEVSLFLLIILKQFIKKDFLVIKVNYLYLIFILYISILTFYTTLVNFNILISGKLYPAISIYIYLHTMVLFYFILFVSYNKIYRISDIIKKILYYHMIIAILLYLLNIFGLNNILLGVNYHSIPIPRMMGLAPEPSHYSIIAWIFFYYYFFNGKNKFITYLALIAFILSFSTTGIIFALLTIIFSILFDSKRKIIIWIILLSFFIVVIPIEYFNRYLIRIISELTILWDYIILGQTINLIDIGQNSRAVGIAYQFILIKNNWLHMLCGLGGSGSQVLLIGSLSNTFKGIIYVFAEYGFIGLLFTIYIIANLYKKTTKNFKALFIAYFIISFFNPPGGNFGFDWIFILYVIYLLSYNKNNTKLKD